MKIVLIISSLGAGGAERVLVGIANWLVAIGYDITILTLSASEDFYSLDKRIKRERLNVPVPEVPPIFSRRIFNSINRLYQLRKAIVSLKPQICISFIEKVNLFFLFATQGLKVRKIVSERNDPSIYRNQKRWLWLRKVLYPSADCVVVQSQKARNWIAQHVKTRTLIVIPNAIDQYRKQQIEMSIPAATNPNIEGYISCVGRLHPDKGHERLLHSCVAVFDKYPNWHLDIVGDGPLRDQLQSLINELGLSANISLLGLQENPFPYLKRSEIFVLPSYVEGFPNVLIEAMATNNASVVYDCIPGGVLDNEENGLLVKDGDLVSFSHAIMRLIENNALRKKIQQSSLASVARFQENHVMNLWESVIN